MQDVRGQKPGPDAATLQVLHDIVRDVAELPDRTSPEDWPEAMLVTGEELIEIMWTRLSRLSGERSRDELFRLRLKIKDADAIAKVADDWVKRGIIDARSALADARLNYGKPYEYESDAPGFLPAPPSEPERDKCPNCEVGLCGVHGNTSAGRGNQPREGREG